MLLLLCVVVQPTPAALDPDVARELALAQTHHADLDHRRRAYAWLGEVANAGDLPILLVALYDEDIIVRANAETSVWQVWSRSGDVAADELFQVGLTQMQRGELLDAVETYTRLIKLAYPE